MDDLSGELESVETEDPEKASQRMAAAREELDDAEAELAALATADGEASESLLTQVQRLHLAASIAAARSSLNLIEQARISRDSRERILLSEIALARARLEQTREILGRIEEAIALKRREIAAQSQSAAAEARFLESDNDFVVKLAAAIEELSKSLDESTDDLDDLRQQQSRATAELDSIRTVFTQVRSQLGESSPGREFALILREEQRSLPKTGEIEKAIADRRASISATRAQLYELDRQQRKLSGAGELSQLAGNSEIESELLEQQNVLIARLQETLENLNTGRINLSATEQAYLREVESFRRYLSAKLFWVPSSSPIYRELVPNLRDSLLLSGQRIAEIPGKASVKALPRSGVFFLGMGILLIACLAGRPAMSRRIQQIGREITRLSRDKWSATLEALAWTVLRALPLPLLACIAARFFRVIGENSFDFALSESLFAIAPVFFTFSWLISLSREDGVLSRHFGWEGEMVSFLRHHLIRWAVVYLPLVLVAMIGVKWGQVATIDGISRWAFIAAMGWTAFVLRSLLSPQNRFARRFLQSRPDSWIAHLRNVWYLLAISIPLILAAGAIAGYFLTAFTLHLFIQKTVAIVALGPIFYGILARACLVHERRINFHRRLEERQVASTGNGEDEAGTQKQFTETPEEVEEPVDLTAVSDQTRHLLRFLTFILVGYSIWTVWASLNSTLDLSPAESDQFGIGTIFRAVLVIVITFVAVRDIPGAMEFIVLRNTPLDAGARDAVKTITSYVLIGLGIAVTFEVLNINWSQFGWIAAALSVGLGFGLQEVVANFVCGLILLFERPLRRGDVVTVGDVTGTVTRLQIRSTTITNWDRKEYIVPNKEFITGTLMNWTLSNTLNRIVIPVGIAYGSDVHRAREVLLQVCHDHPEITDDPGPIVTFEEFGDSSLNLVVRCYLPTMDKRLQTIHELHCAIHEQFAQAGIEIPFPQRDIHLRGASGGADRG